MWNGMSLFSVMDPVVTELCMFLNNTFKKLPLWECSTVDEGKGKSIIISCVPSSHLKSVAKYFANLVSFISMPISSPKSLYHKLWVTYHSCFKCLVEFCTLEV